MFHANGNQKEASVYQTKQTLKQTVTRQKRTLHNGKGVNPTRGYNIYKYLCTQNRRPKYIKQILALPKGEIDHNTTIERNCNTPLTSIDRSSRMKINRKYWP